MAEKRSIDPTTILARVKSKDGRTLFVVEENGLVELVAKSDVAMAPKRRYNFVYMDPVSGTLPRSGYSTKKEARTNVGEENYVGWVVEQLSEDTGEASYTFEPYVAGGK